MKPQTRCRPRLNRDALIQRGVELLVAYGEELRRALGPQFGPAIQPYIERLTRLSGRERISVTQAFERLAWPALRQDNRYELAHWCAAVVQLYALEARNPGSIRRSKGGAA